MKQESIIPKAWRSWRSAIAKLAQPKKLAKLAETGIALRNLRKSLEAHAEAVGKEERALKEYVIENFADSDLTEVRTKAGSMKLVTKILPQMDEATGGWDAIWKYVKNHDAFDLLQKRLHERACVERWEQGETIPGVKKFIKKDLKLGDAE